MENTAIPVQPVPVDPQGPMQPAPKSGHKVLWIVLGIVGFFILLGVIFTVVVGKKISKYVDVEDGQVSIKGENGESITYGGKALPANWPADVPAYPGAESKFSATDKQGVAVVFITSDSLEKVASFYKNELAKNQWVVSATNSANDSSVLRHTSYTKDIRVLQIGIASGGGQTNVTLAVGNK
ncbi:MAG: hypothetical protein AAB483_02155 [Patescibacteria group bacterium]